MVHPSGRRQTIWERLEMAIEERIARLEGIIEEIRVRMNSLDARMNTLTTITVAMWVTTMLAVWSTLAAILLRT